MRILFTGNFDIRKGVRLLLEAIRRCRRSGLDLRLELMGNLGNGASCLQAGDDIFFTHTPFAPLEQVAAAFARADLFVFPTFAEGSSRSGMEAAAAGLPIITTENCGLPLEHGKSAIYVPVNDSDALAEAIARVSVGRRAARIDRQKCNEDCDGELYLDAVRTAGSRVPQGSGRASEAPASSSLYLPGAVL